MHLAQINADGKKQQIRKRREIQDVLQAGGRIFSGNKWPLAMYSKAKRMKMSVETSSSQNASIAMV